MYTPHYLITLLYIRLTNEMRLGPSGTDVGAKHWSLGVVNGPGKGFHPLIKLLQPY